MEYACFSSSIIPKWRNICHMVFPCPPQTHRSPNICTVTLHLVPPNMWWGTWWTWTQVACLKRKWKIHLEKGSRLSKQYISFIMNDDECWSFGDSDYLRSNFQKMSVDLNSTFGRWFHEPAQHLNSPTWVSEHFLIAEEMCWLALDVYKSIFLHRWFAICLHWV